MVWCGFVCISTSWNVLSRIGKGRGAELTEALKLVDEFMDDIKYPFWEEKNGIVCLVITITTIIRRTFRNMLEECIKE